jgi:hypothetical protein
MPDLSLALPRPLTTEQIRHLLKISDADRAIAARVAKAYAKWESAVPISNLTAADLSLAIEHGEQIAPQLAKAQMLVARLEGARLIADDEAWRDVFKIADYLKPREKDDPDLAADFQFLHDYLSSRHSRRAPAAATSSGADSGESGSAVGADESKKKTE